MEAFVKEKKKKQLAKAAEVNIAVRDPKQHTHNPANLSCLRTLYGILHWENSQRSDS